MQDPELGTNLPLLTGIVRDTYRRFYKSAPIPPKPTDGFVKIVVASTYEEIVLDPAKDVILIVYTVW